jgi:hypothetical protein
MVLRRTASVDGHAMEEMQMRHKSMAFAAACAAAACALSLCVTGSAFAGSVTQPGETVGVAAGAPLPPGFYFINTADWGCRNTSPEDTCVGVTIPVGAWSTPWTLLGARVQFLVATPAIEVGVHNTNFGNIILQGYVTTDVAESNYGGRDTRGWTRVIIPLGDPFARPTPLVTKY